MKNLDQNYVAIIALGLVSAGLFSLTFQSLTDFISREFIVSFSFCTLIVSIGGLIYQYKNDKEDKEFEEFQNDTNIENEDFSDKAIAATVLAAVDKHKVIEDSIPNPILEQKLENIQYEWDQDIDSKYSEEVVSEKELDAEEVTKDMQQQEALQETLEEDLAIQDLEQSITQSHDLSPFD